MCARERSNSNTSWTVKSLGEIWGMDEPVPWQQKQREGGVAETPEVTAPAFSWISLITGSKMFTQVDSSLMLMVSVDFLYNLCDRTNYKNNMKVFFFFYSMLITPTSDSGSIL